jgi:hypothetical protein
VRREGMGAELNASAFLDGPWLLSKRSVGATRQAGPTKRTYLARVDRRTATLAGPRPKSTIVAVAPPFERTAAAPDRTMALGRTLWYNCVMPSEAGRRRVITSRVFRAGETPPDDDWSGISVAERIDAVWELTRQCLEWTRTGTDEPRLQRSVSRVQRARR